MANGKYTDDLVEVMVETNPGHWLHDWFSSREEAIEFFNLHPEYPWAFVNREA